MALQALQLLLSLFGCGAKARRVPSLRGVVVLPQRPLAGMPAVTAAAAAATATAAAAAATSHSVGQAQHCRCQKKTKW